MYNFLVKSILFFVVYTSIFAGTDGTIRGKVLDETGNPLPGAQIYIESLGVGTMADADGNYLLLNIQVGEYEVTIDMISYSRQVISGVSVMMDQTVWLNFTMSVEAIEGDVIYVSAEKALVEKNQTSKKVTVSKEAIEALPVRDVTDLYSLQSGVVKVESRLQGIPDQEERGLVEMHVRGGRSGEIAYMIDGMYIRNPIFGGIGSGTRLNLLAIKEFDWQPGGFNAEYGDAMSAVSNWHTSSGSDEFSYKMNYKTSMVGALMGNEYDDLRGHNDISLGIGGKIPLLPLYFWISGEKTDNESYSVYEFDNIVYNFETSPWEYDEETQLITTNESGDAYNEVNKNNLVQPWDTVAGFRGFGFDRTQDIFGKLTLKPFTKMVIDLSYWKVENHRKIFDEQYLYWNEGQNELFRDTERFAINVNHSLTSRSFYTVRASRFIQDQFQGVRWQDTDSDGYPDWFEWRHPAGSRRDISDINNPAIIPYTTPEGKGDQVYYTKKDERSGWYYGAEPGLYNWEVAEDFQDNNNNGVFDEGIDEFDVETHDLDGDGLWDGPEKVVDTYHRDGDHWLYPEMYESYEYFYDYEDWYNTWNNSPLNYDNFYWLYSTSNNANDPYYFLPNSDEEYWFEGNIFGGNDRFYGSSRAISDEIRFDFTSQLTNQLKIRTGVDYKTHRLNFYEVINPWSTDASIQIFGEYWEDFGIDQIGELDVGYEAPDKGEYNGKYDEGEKFSDFNNNGLWDDFVEPIELAGYFQGSYELPWMVINAGIRADGVHYNTKVYADPAGNFSPGNPYFYIDCGSDVICPIDDNYTGPDVDGTEDNDIWDEGEISTQAFGVSSKQKPIFKDAEWLFKYSPRLGFSHVITDQATFTFNYGLYYQTPTYSSIFLNMNKLPDIANSVDELNGLGNATMTASRTQAYEFGFNVQVGRHWAYSVMGWVKDMDQLVTTRENRMGTSSHSIMSNGDFGRANGIDLSLENRGMLVNTMIQYTLSQAKANSEYSTASLGNNIREAPLQEFTMPFDRTHNLVATFYTFLPLGINAALTYSIQSGAPYTPMIEAKDGTDYIYDPKNKYYRRSDYFKNASLSFSKHMKMGKTKISLGLDVYNLFDMRNQVGVWPITGEADDPGEHFTRNIGLPYMVPKPELAKPSSYYDQPWYLSSPREINFFVRFDFN